MFISWKRAYGCACLALLLVEASCSSSGGGVVPGTSAFPDTTTSTTAAHDATVWPAGKVQRATQNTIVACHLVTPKKTLELKPPKAQTFQLPPSFNPSGYVYYFEIGTGNYCYSLPETILYTTVPGTLNVAKDEVTFEQGHDAVTLQAGQTYIFVVYAVPAKAAEHLYEIDHGTSFVSVWPADTNGDVAPEYKINNVGGPHGQPQGIAEDPKGEVFVTTIGADGVTTSVVVYAPGARGNAKPERVITGPATGLNNNASDTGVASDGTVYVNTGSGIAVFGPDADGNVAPERLITNLNGAGAAVTPDNILFTSTAFGKSANEIDAFGPTANGPAAPLYSLEGSKAAISGQLVGADSQGNVYQCRNTSIIEFASFQQGNVYPIRGIFGKNEGFVGLQPIAVDGAANVFVGDEDGAKLYRFAPQADRDTLPVATIAGSNTGLINPAAIAVGK
jgi:hypothetical protein